MSNIHNVAERAHIVSPPVSHAASNLIREVSASRGVRESPGLDTDGEDAGAAAALAEMDLNGGLGLAAAAAPQEEETDFPALEGSPPAVGLVETSEGEEIDGQVRSLLYSARSCVPKDFSTSYNPCPEKVKRLLTLLVSAVDQSRVHFQTKHNEPLCIQPASVNSHLSHRGNCSSSLYTLISSKSEELTCITVRAASISVRRGAPVTGSWAGKEEQEIDAVTRTDEPSG